AGPGVRAGEGAGDRVRADHRHDGRFDRGGTSAALRSRRHEPQRGDDIHNVRVVDVTTGAVRMTSYRHSKLVRDMAFSSDGRYFATGSFDETARVWETATGRPAGPPLAHTSYFATVAFSPDGTTLAAGDYDFNVKLWDWRTGKEVRPPLRHDDIILNVAFSPDGRDLAAVKADDWSKNAELFVWE